jgi:predicted DNA-binding protein (MmcQ/YjbR family)
VDGVGHLAGMSFGFNDAGAGYEEELAAAHRNLVRGFADIKWIAHESYFNTSVDYSLRWSASSPILTGMNAEQTRTFILTLPHVIETGSMTKRWGDKLVFRVGAQAGGGKMFAQFDFVEDGRAILSFAIALEHWNVFRRGELEELLRRAHALTYTRLPKRTRESLAASDRV